ncbi:MAG: tetratricopeptide repeat protein [Bryobacteraceae bacterium]|nr:tetratricopeptide repeat protein [Bryobacteraceae bacterium]
MFSRRGLGLLTAGVLLLALCAAVSWRAWRGTHAGEKRAARIALLSIDNQTGAPGLDWAGAAILEAAQLQLGLGDPNSVFQARDAGDAATRQATHLVYGRIEPEWTGMGQGSGSGAHPGWVTYTFSLEDVARHEVISRVRDSGPVLKAASALASLLAPAAGVRSIRPAGVGNDQALEFFATQKYAQCTGADPQAFWCWERWAAATFEAGRKDEALSIVARGRKQGTHMPAFALARLDLVEASIRGDAALRMAALERLVQADPSNAAALMELATAMTANRQFSRAESLYRNALQRNASQPELWNLLAYAQAWQGHIDAARQSLAEYDRLAPGDPNPADSRGEIEWMAGNLPGAESWFLNSYRRDAKFNGGVALEKAALCRYLTGDEAAAEKLINQFLADRDRAGDALAAFHRARWQFLFGDTAGAEALLEGMVQRGGPDAPLAASRLMLAALRNSDIPAARRYADVVRRLTPKAGNPFLVRIAAALADGDASAIPDPVLRSELTAVRLTLRGDFAQALPAWDESLRSPHGGSDTFAQEMKAWCLLRAGRNAEAAGLVKAGWPLLDNDDRLLFDFLVYPNLLFVRAEAAAARGDAAEARRLYDVYLRYAGGSKDRYGQVDKARTASRL